MPLFRGFVDCVHMQMMAALGYTPELSRCLLTGIDADEGVFDPTVGGLVAKTAARSQQHPAFSREHRTLVGKLLEQQEPPDVDPGFPIELTRAFRSFVAARLDHPLRSDAFLNAMLAEQ